MFPLFCYRLPLLGAAVRGPANVLSIYEKLRSSIILGNPIKQYRAAATSGPGATDYATAADDSGLECPQVL